MTTTLERRLGAVEKRMGITGRSLDQVSDADLDALLEWVHLRLAEQGNRCSIAELAAGDVREAQVRMRTKRQGSRLCTDASPLCAGPISGLEALRKEECPDYRGPRSARTEKELQQKLNAVFATLRARP